MNVYYTNVIHFFYAVNYFKKKKIGQSLLHFILLCSVL